MAWKYNPPSRMQKSDQRGKVRISNLDKVPKVGLLASLLLIAGCPGPGIKPPTANYSWLCDSYEDSNPLGRRNVDITWEDVSTRVDGSPLKNAKYRVVVRYSCFDFVSGEYTVKRSEIRAEENYIRKTLVAPKKYDLLIYTVDDLGQESEGIRYGLDF